MNVLVWGATPNQRGGFDFFQFLSNMSDMKSISAALLFAIQYIENRSNELELDDDVAVLEAISAELQRASPEEKQILRNLAEQMDCVNLLQDLGI